MQTEITEPLIFPTETKQLVLLCCCAPCSCEVIERLAKNNIHTTILFYNPNIFPEQEYNRRLRENRRIAIDNAFPFIDLDWDNEAWFKEIKGLEEEPEQGKRCSKCFAMRLEKAFQFAKSKGFKVVSSTLATSRWKNLSQVNEIGNAIAQKHDMIYWDINWKKSGGQPRQQEIVKEKNIYVQDYCGCPFSIDVNKVKNKKETLKKQSEPPVILESTMTEQKELEKETALSKHQIYNLLK